MACWHNKSIDSPIQHHGDLGPCVLQYTLWSHVTTGICQGTLAHGLLTQDRWFTSPASWISWPRALTSWCGLVIVAGLIRYSLNPHTALMLVNYTIAIEYEINRITSPVCAVLIRALGQFDLFTYICTLLAFSGHDCFGFGLLEFNVSLSQ